MYRSLALIFLFSVYSDGAKICLKRNDCMPFGDCTNARERAEFDKSAETIRLFRQAYCGMSETGHTKVCCSEFQSAPMPQTPSSVDNRLLDIDAPDSKNEPEVVTSRTGSLGNTKARPGVVETEHPNLKLLPTTCGSLYEYRIIGGITASMYEFPWMALISYEEDGNLQFECAGTIINKRYILTAAHCVVGKTIAGVRIGEYDIRYDEDCQGNHCESHLQDVRVEQKIVHERYEGFPDYNDDIALLRVAADIDLSHKNTDTICLPVSRELKEGSITNKMATVTGWGLTETNKESSRLLKVIIPVHSNIACQDHYRQMENPETKSFCAGIFRKDSCRGDSGGPLMIEATYKGVMKFVQFGIVSNGPIRCGTNTPGIYTDVRKYVDWILDKLKE